METATTNGDFETTTTTTTTPETTTTTRHQQRVFLEAVRTGDMTQLRQLLVGLRPCGVNVNEFNVDGQTALHHSCLTGNLDLVKLLVRSVVYRV